MKANRTTPVTRAIARAIAGATNQYRTASAALTIGACQSTLMAMRTAERVIQLQRHIGTPGIDEVGEQRQEQQDNLGIENIA